MRLNRTALWIAGACFLFITAALLIGWLKQSPLHVHGITYGLDDRIILLATANEGKRDISLSKITFNDGQKPEKTELGLSYTGQLVLGHIEESDVQFLGIQDMRIAPDATPEEKDAALKRKDIPIHYGVRVTGNQAIHEVTIHYTYFGFPFKTSVPINQS